MKLTRLCKEPGSGNGGCPTVYLAEDGSFVVQGQLVDVDTEDRLENPLPGEGAVHIAPEIIFGAIAKYQQGVRR